MNIHDLQEHSCTTWDGDRSYCCSVWGKDYQQVERLWIYLIQCHLYMCIDQYCIDFSPVILEAPIGQNSDIWTLIQPILAEHTKVTC